MTPSAEIIRTTGLHQFGGVYLGLKNQYKILLNINNFRSFSRTKRAIETWTANKRT